MAESISFTKARNSRYRTFVYSGLLFLASFLVGLVAVEIGLGYLRKHIESSDRMDPGMFAYDSVTGWRLNPGWTGSHRHYDFDVRYSINRLGFRGPEPGWATNPKSARFAIVGDSFTFGLGVDDGDTFVQILNRENKDHAEYLNFSVPGYSTDQELLLIERRVLDHGPDVVVVVVYLGNDLIDNERGYPLQAQNAKPYFIEGSNGRLLPRNIPVPKGIKPPAVMKRTFAKVVLGDMVDESNALVRSLGRLEILRWLGSTWPRPRDISETFELRFRRSLELFSALIERIRSATFAKNAHLALVLLPGRSFIEEPEGYSAQYQDYIRSAIMARQTPPGMTVIDLAAALRRAYERKPERWYHAHEGHLTKEGHRAIATMLSPLFKRLSLPPGKP